MFFTLCILLVIFKHVALFDFPGTPDNYGPFTVKWLDYKVCRGPKPKNDTLFQSKLDLNGDSYGAEFNITVCTASTRFAKVIITVYTIKSGIKQNQLWTYKLENPCQHMVIGALVESKLGAKNCVLQKGFYHTHVNYSALVHDFFGNAFFYGEFIVKTVILSKTGNVGCLSIYTVFSKLK